MNKIKKLLAILVAFVMCFTVFGMVASASVQDTQVYLKLNYADNAAKTVNANISTSQACGAIQGTITYEGATFDSASFINGGDNDDEYVNDSKTKTIKFVAVTDDLAKGDTNWVNFKFTINSDATDVTFTLTDVSVCDVGATDIKKGITLDPQQIIVDTTIRTLGGQFRDPETSGKDAALRFGTDLKRNKDNSEITIGNQKYTAVSCGYIVGFDFSIAYKTGAAKEALTSYVELQNDKLVKKTENNGVTIKESHYYFESNETDLIYTYAIKGFYEADGTTPKTSNLDGTNRTLINEKISAVPYVIYKDSNGDYAVKYGDEISRSYTEVKEIYDLAKQ